MLEHKFKDWQIIYTDSKIDVIYRLTGGCESKTYWLIVRDKIAGQNYIHGSFQSVISYYSIVFGKSVEDMLPVYK